MKHLLTIVSFILFSLTIKGQVYPVQVNTQIMPPFTPYLSDYTAPGSEKFMTQIRVTDPTLSDYTCKLRITIEGVNITIRSKPSFPFQPLNIPGGGIPQIFYGEDLAEYFNPNALDFLGITRSEYEKGARLPEGVYRFSVEVLDYNRGTLVSNKGTAVAWIILNDPPILNLPYNNSKTKLIDPTNIPFTWTPRHTGSPNAAFTTQYKFRMIEVWPITRNPYDAFLSQPTLYETTTDFTQIVYGIAEPALLPGRKYAWQVQAVDVDGRDLFKNNGKSEVFVFQFGDALGMPDGLYLQNAGPSSLNIRWEAPTSGLDPASYRIQYRLHNNRKSDTWYETTTQELWQTIGQLQPETEYEVQLRAELNSQFSNYAAPQVFKTTPASSGEFACRSDVQPPPVPSDNTPTPTLKAGDVIHAGGYEVNVKNVTASTGGQFSGDGAAIVPWFMGARVHVTFKNISVNSQLWLTAGEIKTVWNANSPFLVTAEKKVESGNNAPAVGAVDVTLATADEVIKITGTIIAAVTKDSDGNVVVYTTDGQTKVLPKDKSYAIVDEAGNGYVVDKQGNIAKTTATAAQDAANRGNRTYNISMRFEKGNGKFGFDKKKYDALAQYYQPIDATHYTDWKAVSTAQSDPVDAILEGTKFDPKKVRFELSASPITPTPPVNGKYTLNVTGKAEGAQEELLALYKETEKDEDQVLGKLNLISYAQVSKNLVIVPVKTNALPNGIDANTLTQKLTEIYGQAITNWSVIVDPPLDLTFSDKFDDGESGLLTNYTDDMKKVINTYGQLKDNTYYLFLVSNSKSGKTLGYMPRSKQAGFIFVDKLDNTTIVNTIAHEIGHGAFNLQHTFSEFTSLTKGTTDNLMDYNNSTGSALYKYQWDHIHDPQHVIGLFESDESGQLSATMVLSDPIPPETESTETCYITPDGQVFSTKSLVGFANIPQIASDVPYAVQAFTKAKYQDNELIGFENTLYRFRFGENGQFGGYYEYDNSAKEFKSGKIELQIVTGGCKTLLYEDIKEEYDKNSCFFWRITKDGTDENVLVNSSPTPLTQSSFIEYITPFIKGATKKLKSYLKTKEQLAANLCNYTINEDGSVDGYQRGYPLDATVQITDKTFVYDYTASLTDDQAKKALSRYATLKAEKNIISKVFIIERDQPSDKDKAAKWVEANKAINAYIQQMHADNSSREEVLVLRVYGANKFNYELYMGNSVPGRESIEKIFKYLHETDTDILDRVGLLLSDFATDLLDGLAGLISEAIIPARYYNPDLKDYNGVPAKIFGFVSLNPGTYIEALGLGYEGRYSATQIQFAAACGVWNGAVDLLGGVVSGASILTKLITNEDNIRSSLWNGIKGFKMDEIKKAIGKEWDKYTANPCMISYGSGYIVFQVASMFIGAGEAGAASKVLQTIEKLDVLGQVMGKVMGVCAKLVIKPVLKKVGSVMRVVIEPIVTMIPESAIKLATRLKTKAKLLIGFPDKLYVSLHATSEGKFIAVIDGVYTELNGEDLAKYLIKTDENVINKEIVLLSCNDLDAAKALAENAGVSVYTTNGKMSIFDDGIKREAGTDWYKVEPDGTQTNLTQTGKPVPVTECTTCTGEGVEMGVGQNPDDLIVARATETQLEEVLARISKDPPSNYVPNTIEHKADRWAQYKLEKGDAAKNYEQWSNIYNANVNKARIAKQVEIDYMNSIGWKTHQYNIKAGDQTRILDMADLENLKAIEIKSYETGKVYATESIRLEVQADRYLVNNAEWQIEWVFKGCEPSQPLRALLEEAGLTIKLIP